MKAVLALVLMILGLGFALNTASCSAQNACTTSTGGSSGTAGAAGSNCVTGASATAGSGGATTCGQLTALQTCFGTFCTADGVGTPFCNCFTKGYDLSAPPDCTCITIDGAAFCQQAADNGLDGSNLDCSAATSSVATQCVDVQ
jgi:hypothetical protein